MKRLLFDITSAVPYFMGGHATGVGRTTMELITALEEIDNLPFDLVYYSQNLKGRGVRDLRTKFKKFHLFIPKRKQFQTITDTIRLKQLLSRYDLYHIPHNTDSYETLSKTIYTIHDLIVYRYPELWNLTEEHKSEIETIGRGCKAIVTCSESSKLDIVKFWGCKPSKVTVIPWGINRTTFFPNSEQIAELPNLQKDFFFSSACNHPRKQPRLMIDAFRQYQDEGGSHQMVLLNPLQESLQGCESLIADGKLIVLRGVTDSLLVKLYSHAKATIVASLYEGFGLPVLESLACHTNVISAKNSSLIEAGGNVVDYIEDMTKDALCAKLHIYDSLKKKETLNTEAIESHLGNFTWKKCAERYVDFWRENLT